MAWLTILMGISLVGIPCIWFLPSKKVYQIGLLLLLSFLQLATYWFFVRPLYVDTWAIDSISNEAFVLVERFSWIQIPWGGLSELRFDFHLRLDGLNHDLVFLTLLIQPIVAGASWTIKKNLRAFGSLLLLLNASILGCFLAFDLFLFYICFEFMLLPMYFLIAIWGGAQREAAALKFFLYTLVGSLMLVLVFLALLFSYPLQVGPQDWMYHLDLSLLANKGRLLSGSILEDAQWRLWAAVAVLLAFAIKIPIAPLHTWLPKAHVEAPTPISIVLAALLLKVGGYGLFRISGGIFHDQHQFIAEPLAWIAVFSILYGGLNALAQSNYKRMIAYSSVSHMGFVLLGFAAATPAGLSGAMFQMFNHGILATALFLTAGMLYDRGKDYNIDHYKGLITRVPYFGFVVGWIFFASLGLPGLNAFVSEFLVFTGAFHASQSGNFLPIAGVFAAILGIFLSAAYFLNTYKKMFFGNFFINNSTSVSSPIQDLSYREWAMMIPLLVLTLYYGLFPSAHLNFTDEALASLSRFMRP